MTWPKEGKARESADFHTDPKLYWTRLDWVLMLSVTLVYAVVSLTTLGSTKAPQHAWKSTSADEAVIIDLGQHYDDISMLYYCHTSYSDFSVAVSDDDENWSEEYWAEMAQRQGLRWKYLVPCSYDDGTRSYDNVKKLSGVQRLSGRYVRITAQQVGLLLNEVIFRDLAGNRIEATVLRAENAIEESPNFSDPANIFDEQDTLGTEPETLKGEPSWYNSIYWDEVFYPRTAYEMNHAEKPYERTHPPLGKVMSSWSVSIFGLTPFGWRFAGALMGILMLPAMYVLGKQLTKRTSTGFIAMSLLAVECMHLAQTQIATIDSYPVFFIIMSWLFMMRFVQRDITADPIKKLLPDLALCGFFMGCGIASKWIGAYSGAGLALVYFWTCARHLGLKRKHCFKRIFQLCLWCLLFFVAVPVVIYLLSYIPHLGYAHKDNLMDFLRLVVEENQYMFEFHSTPGRAMDHSAYTPWNEWPFNVRPLYFSSPRFVPEGYSYALFTFSNPVIGLVGLVGIAAMVFVWAKRHCYTLKDGGRSVHLLSSSWSMAPAFILIGALAQYLPWMLVPRGTFIYHYFASIPFICLSMALLLHWLQQWHPKLGWTVTVIYLLACLLVFVALFPYATGVMTPTWWLDFMKRRIIPVYY